jgi:hypothetical protein
VADVPPRSKPGLYARAAERASECTCIGGEAAAGNAVLVVHVTLHQTTPVIERKNIQYFRASGRGGDFAFDLELCTTARAMEGRRRAAATAISWPSSR